MNRNDGLSTANFLSGAMQGYQFMQGIEDNKLRREELKRNQGLRDADESRRAEQFEMQKQQHAQNNQVHSARMRRVAQEEQESATKALARQLYAIDSGTDLTPEERQELIQATGGSRLLDPQYLSSPEVADALEVYPLVMSGEVNRNDPRALKAYNTILNVQRGAKDGRQVQINRVVPSRDGQGVHVGLHVRNADGSENPNGVLTDGRSSDPNDPVSTISFDEINGVYGATKNLRDLVANPKYRQALYRQYGLGAQPVTAKDQSIIDFNKSRTNYYNAKAENEKSGGNGGNGKLPADAQMIEYYRRMGFSDDDAIALANSAVSSPEKFSTMYSKMLIETSKDSEGRATITPEQAIEQSLKIYEKNFKPKTLRNSGAPKKDDGENIVTDLMRGKREAQTKIPMRARTEAPQAALDFLRENPDQSENFQAKYGYLPE